MWREPPSAVRRTQVRCCRPGKLDQAPALYRQALDKSPDLYEAHLAEGMALDLRGDDAEAREHFTKAIAAGQEKAGDGRWLVWLRALAIQEQTGRR
jgi:tetratricopeptide (TPR) repeat protein